MPQSLADVLVHMIFSTKDRVSFLKDEIVRNELHSQLGGTSKALDCPPIIVGGVHDHVHLLARQSRTISLSDWVKELKRVTSIWIKQQSGEFKSFSWQAGYGAFSVSHSQSGRVTNYIRNQELHHQNSDFKTEFRKFLERHGIEYDERYVWD